ncbi:MAG: glutamate--tRNA ligase [Bryobacterales bacterium]|nr:glutamate--tRNA ligase [Bryobacterales bacterium]
MVRVRFAPSPTGYLHIGSARTFIFNWLFARHNAGTMILRIDDTDVERNTRESLDSIFEGLAWLGLDWDEFYRQSERGKLHTSLANHLVGRGLAYRDFAPARTADDGAPEAGAAGWLFNPEMRELSQGESDARAASGEPFVIRFRVPRDAGGVVTFRDAVYGEQSKSTSDIEDFALLRSSGVPTYHMASCADDIDLKITHIIRGQDHLANTFKHVLLFEAAGAPVPQFAHLPLLIAPDGAKLSKRKHGPVVSVTSYRDAGFLPEAFINFVALLGWNPKDDREHLNRDELVAAFTLAGVNKSNAVINFSEQEPFDPKAVWLNGQHIYKLPAAQLAPQLAPFLRSAGLEADEGKVLAVTPLIQERIRLLRDVVSVADFFFLEKLAPYDPAELIPQKGDRAMALRVLEKAHQLLAAVEFIHPAIESAFRAAAEELHVKAGQMFLPVRVAVCGRKNAPPLFETIEVLGREVSVQRVGEAIGKLQGTAL